MRRMGLTAVAIMLFFFAVPAGAGTHRDPKGDTSALDVRRVTWRHRDVDGRDLWTVRVETYDAFTDEQLRRNSENSMYALAIRFETHDGRPCDRNLQVYVVPDGDDWDPHARITSGGDGDSYQKWDGVGKVYGYPKVWQGDPRSITIRFPESMLSARGLTRFAWGLRTVSGDSNIYMDYVPHPGRLAWTHES